jgi:hypothetical protein
MNLLGPAFVLVSVRALLALSAIAGWLVVLVGSVLFLGCSCQRSTHVPLKPASASAALAVRPPVQYDRSIVLPSDSGPLLRGTGTDAARALSRMTGSEFRVSSTDATRGILLVRTTSPEAPAGDVNRLREEGPEAFVLRGSGTDRFLVIANTDLGLVAGLYDYLRRLGCRWLLPNEDFTIIPRRTDIGLEVDAFVKPAFPSRIFAATGGFGKSNPGDPKLSVAEAWDVWKRRNGFGGSFNLEGHVGEMFNVRHRAVLEAHPEYLALVSGKRSPWSTGAKLCVSNRDAMKLWVDDRLAALRANPTQFAIPVDPADGGGHCECDRCRAIGSGSISDQVFYQANQVAKDIAKEFPGTRASLYAYSYHAALPTIALEPNVYVAAIPDAYQRTGLAPDDLLRAWAKRSKPLGIYTYWGLTDWYNDVPSFDFRTTPAERIRLWHSLGLWSVNIQTNSGAGAMGLGLYAASRLLWDPATDENALVDEFYRLSFEKAAPPMRRLLERWRGDPMPNYLALSYRDLAEARTLAKGNASVEHRIRDFEEYVHYLRLFSEYQVAKAGSPERRDRAREVVRWLYRIEPTAMVSTFRLQQLIIERYEHDAALRAEFDLANWKAPGWQAVSRPTDAELGTLMAEGRAANPPVDFEERRYSPKLVRLARGVLSAPVAPSAIHLAGSTDIELEIPSDRTSIDFAVSVTAGAKVPGDTVTVVDPDGHTIHEEVVLPDGVTRRIVVNTPKPGRYRIHVEDQKAMFLFMPPAGVPMALRALVSPHLSPLVYFFVPKGLRRLAMYAPGVVPIELFDGDGRAVPCGKSGLVLADVPKGQDGRVWSFKNYKSWASFRMLNAPQSFSLSPDTVLVPEDAAR